MSAFGPFDAVDGSDRCLADLCLYPLATFLHVKHYILLCSLMARN